MPEDFKPPFPSAFQATVIVADLTTRKVGDGDREVRVREFYDAESNLLGVGTAYHNDAVHYWIGKLDKATLKVEKLKARNDRLRKRLGEKNL